MNDIEFSVTMQIISAIKTKFIAIINAYWHCHNFQHSREYQHLFYTHTVFRR